MEMAIVQEDASIRDGGWKLRRGEGNEREKDEEREREKSDEVEPDVVRSSHARGFTTWARESASSRVRLMQDFPVFSVVRVFVRDASLWNFVTNFPVFRQSEASTLHFNILVTFSTVVFLVELLITKKKKPRYFEIVSRKYRKIIWETAFSDKQFFFQCQLTLIQIYSSIELNIQTKRRRYFSKSTQIVLCEKNPLHV